MLLSLSHVRLACKMVCNMANTRKDKYLWIGVFTGMLLLIWMCLCMGTWCLPLYVGMFVDILIMA